MNERMTRLVEGQDTWEGEPRRPDTGLKLLAVLVALLLIGGTAWIVLHRNSGDGSASTSSPSPEASSTEQASDRPEELPLATAVPTVAPQGVTWELFQTVALPSSAAGPRVRRGPICAGYDRSPEGALIAALQISTRRLVTPQDGWRQVNLEQVMPSSGRDRFIRLRAQVGDEPPVGGAGQTAGFKFVSYTPEVAVIEIATRFPGRTTYQVTNLTVRWSEGDWRLVLQPDGSDSSSASSTSSLGSFIPFSGV